MKKTAVLALTWACAIMVVSAQDVIYRRSGNKINAVVIEIGESDVSYKSYSNPSGPTYRIKQSELKKITYENGDEDVFNGDEAVEEVKAPPVRTSSAPQRAGSRNLVEPARRVNAPAQNRQQQEDDYEPPVQPRQRAAGNSEYARPAASQRQQPVRQQPVQQQSERSYAYPSTDQGYYSDPPSYRKSYIGIAVGAAITLDDDAYTGTQYNLNFGYLFTRRVGLAASIFHTEYEHLGVTGVLFGPLFAFGGSSGNFSFDLRPSIGYSSWSSYSYTSDGKAAGGLGMSLRWGCGRYVSMSGNWDIYTGAGYDCMQLTLGVNVRLP